MTDTNTPQPAEAASASRPASGRSPFAAYAAALLLVAAAAGLRLAFLGGLGERLVFVTFYPAVMLAALYGGRRSGLLATGLSAVAADYLWLAPLGRLGVASREEAIGLAVFVASGVLGAWLAGRLHAALAETRQAKAALLEHRQQLADLVQARTAALEQEIAERKRAEATLNEAQRIAKIGSWEWDVGTDEAIWSAQTYAIFDVDPEWFVPRFEAVIDLIDADDRERVRTAFYGAVAHGTRYVAEFAVPTRPVFASCSPRRNR